ncbi:MAG: hypothetical protein MUD08_07490 [Cytophagales bacterium]|jgi:hypothetical protein|nr:hypothetical protein [Cytophagales bacterium]
MATPKFNADRLIGISAFIISLGTFAIYIYEASLMRQQAELTRKQQFASVLPYLMTGISYPGKGSFKLVLVNKGLGPAFVKEIRLIYDGKKYEGDPHGFYVRFIQPKDTSFGFMYTNVTPGRVIPAGEMIELIAIQDDPHSQQKAGEWFGSQKAKLEIVYASVYDEKWKLTGFEGQPQKLE